MAVRWDVLEALRCHHYGAKLALTASIGLASTTTPGEQLAPILHTADEKRYEAKLGGRNRRGLLVPMHHVRSACGLAQAMAAAPALSPFRLLFRSLPALKSRSTS